jgi:hypothetical protein
LDLSPATQIASPATLDPVARDSDHLAGNIRRTVGDLAHAAGGVVIRDR